MMRAILIPALIPFLATASLVRGQTPPAPAKEAPAAPAPEAAQPAALRALRARYAESINAADQAVTSRWAASLAALEKTRAAAEDYAGAERLRRRREESLVVAGAEDGRVPIRLSSKEVAKKGSGLKEDEKTGIITILSSGASIDWDISGNIKGAYEVRLTHAVGGKKDRTAEITPFVRPATGERHLKKSSDDSGPRSGLLSFQNVSSLKGTESFVLCREIVSTGGPNEWVTVSMGRLEIAGRIAKFKLVADESGTEPLRFSSLELIPIPPLTAIEDGTGKLIKARDVFDKEFRNHTQSPNNHYRESLTQLELLAQRAGDTDAFLRIRDEKTTLLSTPAQLALGEQTSKGTPLILDAGQSINCYCQGDIIPDPGRKCLTRLRPAGGARVTWKLPAYQVGSGTYTVEIKGRVQLNGGGTATLQAMGKANAVAGPPVKVEVKPVLAADAKPKKPESGAEPVTPENRTIEGGSVVIGKGAESLVFTVTGLTHQDGSLMDLSQVVLRRTGDAPLPGKKP